MFKFHPVIILLCIVFTFNSTLAENQKKTKSSLSYTINLTNNETEYVINVKEYNDDFLYYRRDDWKSPEKGNLSYVIIRKDEKIMSSYLLLHDGKKAFEVLPDSKDNLLIDENWVSDIHLSLFKKEELPGEKVEGYLCTKTRLSGEIQEESCTLWYSPELKHYLKIESNLSGYSLKLEVKDIKTENLDEKFFEIPKDYKVTKIDPKKIKPLPYY